MGKIIVRWVHKCKKEEERSISKSTSYNTSTSQTESKDNLDDIIEVVLDNPSREFLSGLYAMFELFSDALPSTFYIDFFEKDKLIKDTSYFSQRHFFIIETSKLENKESTIPDVLRKNNLFLYSYIAVGNCNREMLYFLTPDFLLGVKFFCEKLYNTKFLLATSDKFNNKITDVSIRVWNDNKQLNQKEVDDYLI